MGTREPLTSMGKSPPALISSCSEYKYFRLKIVEGVLCRSCFDSLPLDMRTDSSGPFYTAGLVRTALSLRHQSWKKCPRLYVTPV